MLDVMKELSLHKKFSKKLKKNTKKDFIILPSIQSIHLLKINLKINF